MTDNLKQRTIQQNRALHLYFQILADTLNDAGLDMKKILKPEIDIPWNKDTVKNFLWRPIQKAQINKKSTTELTTREIDLVFNTLNRHLSQFGIHESFPSFQEVMFHLLANDYNHSKNEKKEIIK